MGRYHRHILLKEIGEKGQQKIATARVIVVGAGGLGCPALQYLVAAGIGTIGIVDFDTVEESNLQRQILYGRSSLGLNKAIAAKERLEDLNHTITINAVPKRLSFHNAFEIFENYDIIIDATDNFASRYLINDAAILKNKAIVYGGIHKFEGQISVFNFQQGPSYRCLFPENKNAEKIPNCSENGVLGVLPGIIGAMQANEAIKIILNLEGILSGRLLCYDALSTKSTIINTRRSSNQINIALNNKDKFLTPASTQRKPSIRTIVLSEAVSKSNVQFIDVRELSETPIIKDERVLQIPLSTIKLNLTKIEDLKEIVFFCQSGKRAITAIETLNIPNCYYLRESAEEVLNELNKPHNIKQKYEKKHS